MYNGETRLPKIRKINDRKFSEAIEVNRGGSMQQIGSTHRQSSGERNGLGSAPGKANRAKKKAAEPAADYSPPASSRASLSWYGLLYKRATAGSGNFGDW